MWIVGSKDELEDLKDVYKQFEGDMDEILDNMMCCTIDDEPRFRWEICILSVSWNPSSTEEA